MELPKMVMVQQIFYKSVLHDIPQEVADSCPGQRSCPS